MHRSIDKLNVTSPNASPLPYTHMLLGKVLGGRYRIIKRLGDGGFGETYLAEDLHLPGYRQCVVKHLLPKNTNPAAMQIARRLFNREAEVLYQLGNHDRIPHLYAHFEEEREFYLVQEFIEGDVLSQELQLGSSLSQEEVFLLLQDILTTLEFVHQQHVIHRDIKPSNLIRRRQDGKIVLIDFGAVKQISTQLTTAQGHTTWSVAIGSPGYTPNEQLVGNPRLSSDIYAVGMLGIQALTGFHPQKFNKDSHTSEIVWHNWVQINPHFAAVLDKMVRYDFRQRYPSATEALQALTSPEVVRDLKLPKSSTEDRLASDVGIDYCKLQQLLAARKWREADAETTALMLQACHKTDWLGISEVENFPCLDLTTIDQLWLKYSEGRFGFSVQKQIWQNLNVSQPADYVLALIVGDRNVADSETCIDFGSRIGWRKQDSWVEYGNLHFSLEAPEGHLPFFGFFERVWRMKLLGLWEWHSAIATSEWWRLCVSLFSRLETCQRDR